MKVIHTKDITEAIREMCIEANHFLSEDMKEALNEGERKETSPVGRQIFSQLKENLDIAGRETIPICQDTGMTVVFVRLGQEIHIEGGGLTEAIEEGVRQGYMEGYLRKSVVRSPFDRTNTKDNTPAIIHYDIVPGDELSLTVAPKGAGSENMSKIFMLKPADGLFGVKEAVISAISQAGPNACPPFVIGVGIGGNFEQCALLAKKALVRDLHEKPDDPLVRKMEEELLLAINELGIGPAGLGGEVTALAVNIETFATHIASLPVAINIGCHVNRHVRRVLP